MLVTSRDIDFLARNIDIIDLYSSIRTLRNGANPHITLDDGSSLVAAVIKGGDIFELFLSAGVNLNARDPQGMTAFLVACKAGQTKETLTKLVEAGADMSLADNSGKNALHLATLEFCSGTEVDSIQFLLANGVPVNALDNAQMSPLRYAIRRNSSEAVEALLDAGADVLIPSPDTLTPLHILLPYISPDGFRYSGREKFIPLVQRLIEAGVDKEARDSSGNTPIFGYVAKQPSYDDDGHDEMNAFPDLEEQLQVLTNHNLHARNIAGETLLHIAANRSRHVFGLPKGQDDTRDMFKFLWELGLDSKTEDGSQKTALDVAAACGNTGILDLFIFKP